jgi:hypothetical protein
MREHWHHSDIDGLDEPAAAARAFPAPGRPARLHRQPVSDQWAASVPRRASEPWQTGDHRPEGDHGRANDQLPPGEQQWLGEHGLRWPPAESRPDWLLDDLDNGSARAQTSPFSRRYGAALGVASRRGGRFAAEWSASGTSSRSSRRAALLPRRLRRFNKDGGVMARRALLERGAEFTADDEVRPSQPHSVRPDQATLHWRGAGGRWLIWVGRAIAWAVLLLIGYRGVLAIIQGPAPSAPAGFSKLPTGSAQFPVTAAEAYALQFGGVYLNFSPASTAVRNQDLSQFLPPGTDPALGFDGAGTQRMLDEQVAAISVTGKHTAIVTLLARLGNGRLIDLGVPIYAAAGGMSVSGYPALLPGPRKVVPAPATRQISDQATESALQAQLPAFFEAYARGDQGTLARFTAPGAHITGLRDDINFGGIDSLYVPAGGSTRQISVTVSWQLPAAGVTSAKSPAAGIASAALQMTYQMTVVRQGGSWDIRSIGASTRPLAQGPP